MPNKKPKVEEPWSERMRAEPRLALAAGSRSVPTYVVTIHMAGDIDTARQRLRREVYEHGLCVTIAPESFIYTGGEEQGFAVGLVNYPRFPSKPADLWARACEIAFLLIDACCQRTALLVAPDRTEWLRVVPPGERCTPRSEGVAGQSELAK